MTEAEQSCKRQCYTEKAPKRFQEAVWCQQYQT